MVRLLCLLLALAVAGPVAAQPATAESVPAAEAAFQNGLAAYQQRRQPIARKIVDAANTSAEWYESFGEKMRLEPMDFAYDYMMRSGRMTDARLHAIAPQFADRYERHRAVAG